MIFSNYLNTIIKENCLEIKTNWTSFDDSEIQNFFISKITLWAYNLTVMFGHQLLRETGKWHEIPLLGLGKVRALKSCQWLDKGCIKGWGAIRLGFRYVSLIYWKTFCSLSAYLWRSSMTPELRTTQALSAGSDIY